MFCVRTNILYEKHPDTEKETETLVMRKHCNRIKTGIGNISLKLRTQTSNVR